MKERPWPTRTRAKWRTGRGMVAETLEMRVKDPRLGMVTITDARVTATCSEATVFYTVYGGDEERAATAAALESPRACCAARSASRPASSSPRR